LHPHDKELFAAATKVIIGDGKKARFWEAPWLDGMRPKDIGFGWRILDLPNQYPRWPIG
jgi:hypothetical protein